MLTQNKLKSVLHYCSDSGVFTWTNPSKHVKYHKGKTAGKVAKNGYVYIGIMGKAYLAHRLAWLYMYGAFPNDQIDHINGNTVDNRMSNLRDVSNLENSRNMKRQINNTSGVTGVHKSTKRDKWVAKIKVKGKVIALGHHRDFNAARMTRWLAERAYGFHENHGKRLTCNICDS